MVCNCGDDQNTLSTWKYIHNIILNKKIKLGKIVGFVFLKNQCKICMTKFLLNFFKWEVLWYRILNRKNKNHFPLCSTLRLQL